MTQHLPGRTRAAAAALLAVAGLLTAAPARAADDAKTAPSLRLVPADAAFYSASLHNREQLNAVLQSKAWAKLRDLPAVQMALQKIQKDMDQPDGPLAKFRQFQQDPQNQQLLSLLGDMFSHECFFFGAEDVAGFIDLSQQLNAASIQGAIQQISQPGKNANEMQAKLMLKALAEKPELVRIPDLVFGFKLSQAEPAEQQLKRLEGIVRPALQRHPQLKDRLKTAKVGGGQFLTLTLDGGLIPWDQISLDKFESTPGEFDNLIKKVKESTLTISLGVRDQYLVLAIGPTTAAVAKLGQGQALGDRPEFKQLARAEGKRLTDVSYVSKALMARVATSRNDIAGMAAKAKEALKGVNLPEELRKRLEKDAQELAKDLQAYINEPGATLSYSFITERGQESFTFDWGEHKSIDGSKPLTLLNHVGGSPLLAAVGRSKYNPDNYAKLVKWIKRVDSYVEDFALPQLPADAREMYGKVTEFAFPLLKRLDEATGKLLLPALADGQSAFVFDAKLKSKKWVEQMPEAKAELPLPEIAFVFGVSDAGKLKKAFEDYRGVINDALAIFNNATGGFFPELKMPPPQTKQAKGGTVYYYPIPSVPGIFELDQRLLPNAGLGKSVADLSLSLEHSERLLANTPLKTGSPILEDLKRPRASAVFFNWAGVVDAIAPWVDYVIEQAVPPSGAGDGGPDKASILKQVHTVLEVLKVLRTYASSTYFEGEVLVTHSETIIRDIE